MLSGKYVEYKMPGQKICLKDLCKEVYPSIKREAQSSFVPNISVSIRSESGCQTLFHDQYVSTISCPPRTHHFQQPQRPLLALPVTSIKAYIINLYIIFVIIYFPLCWFKPLRLSVLWVLRFIYLLSAYLKYIIIILLFLLDQPPYAYIVWKRRRYLQFQWTHRFETICRLWISSIFISVEMMLWEVMNDIDTKINKLNKADPDGVIKHYLSF